MLNKIMLLLCTYSILIFGMALYFAVAEKKARIRVRIRTGIVFLPSMTYLIINLIILLKGV